SRSRLLLGGGPLRVGGATADPDVARSEIAIDADVRVRRVQLVPEFLPGAGGLEAYEIALPRQETKERVLVLGVQLDPERRADRAIGDEILVDLRDRHGPLEGLGATGEKGLDQLAVETGDDGIHGPLLRLTWDVTFDSRGRSRRTEDRPRLGRSLPQQRLGCGVPL